MSVVAAFVPFSELFPECSPTEHELKQQLASLSRTDALIWCARLNLVASVDNLDDALRRQFEVIGHFLTHEQATRLANFLNARKEDRNTLILIRQHILELMQWIAAYCCDLESDGTSFRDESVRHSFVKALFICGELWGKRVYDGKLIPESTSDLEEQRMRSLGAMRIGSEASVTEWSLMFAIARGRRLFVEFLPRFRQSFFSEFRTVTGIGVDTFYGIVTLIANHNLKHLQDTRAASDCGTALFREDAFPDLGEATDEACKAYVRYACQSPDDLSKGIRTVLCNGMPGNWKGAKQIRERPVLRTMDGRCIVLDPVFFAGHVSVGPLFSILEAAPNDKAYINECFEDFGYAFEDYVHSIMRTMYPSPPAPLVDRLILNPQGTDEQGDAIEVADAYLSGTREFALFEIKAQWLRDELAESPDPNTYLRALRDKYAQSADESRPKGVGQLARSITKICSSQWRINVADVSTYERIYPVLVPYDEMLGSGTHSRILSEEFCRILNPDCSSTQGSMLLGRFQIERLIVIPIGLLEILETSVVGFSFFDLLRDYSMACPDRLASLHTYIASSAYGDKILYSRSLATSAISALETAGELMGYDLGEGA